MPIDENRYWKDPWYRLEVSNEQRLEADKRNYQKAIDRGTQPSMSSPSTDIATWMGGAIGSAADSFITRVAKTERFLFSKLEEWLSKKFSSRSLVILHASIFLPALLLGLYANVPVEDTLFAAVLVTAAPFLLYVSAKYLIAITMVTAWYMLFITMLFGVVLAAFGG